MKSSTKRDWVVSRISVAIQLDPQLSHQFLHSLMIEIVALRAKHCLHPTIAIATFMGMEDGFDLDFGIQIRIWFKTGINSVVIDASRHLSNC